MIVAKHPSPNKKGFTEILPKITLTCPAVLWPLLAAQVCSTPNSRDSVALGLGLTDPMACVLSLRAMKRGWGAWAGS